MPREFPRTRRVGEQLRRDLAELIRTETDDPRLTLVSITSAEVSRDLGHARVYVTYLGESGERATVLSELNRLAPLLRGHLGRRLRLRTVPRLRFIYDDSVERGAELSDLIDRAVASDRARHRDDESEGDA
ncbi:MAG: 30S ribosome-binding factor RbfA [Candidatus Competibacterales bacterium]|nr:30S ribosome-binding factor RbfA [Candidatus Competibacterales bacterium]